MSNDYAKDKGNAPGGPVATPPTVSNVPEGVDPRLPHRVTDPETGKTKVVLGKVGFNMGLRRPGEPRMTPDERKAKEAAQLKVNLKG